jgi:hypothetical protein
MRRLDPRFIEEFSKEAGRLMKAIRCIQALEINLPEGFPEPGEIKVARRPYDLELEWVAEHPKHAQALQSRISAGLKLQAKWNMDPSCGNNSIVCRARVNIGEKASLNLHLRINNAHNFNTAGTVSARSSGRRD